MTASARSHRRAPRAAERHPLAGVVVEGHDATPRAAVDPALRHDVAHQRADCLDAAPALGQDRRQHGGRAAAGAGGGRCAATALATRARPAAGRGGRRRCPSRSPSRSRRAAPRRWRPRAGGRSRSATDDAGRRAAPASTEPADVPTNSSNSRTSMPSSSSQRLERADHPGRAQHATAAEDQPPASGGRAGRSSRVFDRCSRASSAERVDDALAEHVDVRHRVAVGVEAVVDPAVVGRQPDATGPGPWPAGMTG